MQGKVDICGMNTAQLPLLSGERSRELLRRAKAGDGEAREELIEGNLRLVLSVIQRFSGRGENSDDLFQVGCIGLIKAIDNFDLEQHDVRFSTYGVPAIMGWRKAEKRFFHHDKKASLGAGRSSSGWERGSRSSPTYHDR